MTVTVQQSPASSSGRQIHPAQFRITRLQVYNWGPFCDLHTYPFPDAGLLITGQSGTGKSTLQDAISTLLFATGKAGYNASGSEGQFGGRDGDRDLAGYVRGLYGSGADGGSLYLRAGGTTWSAVGCTWQNAAGVPVTAVGVFYFNGTAVNTGSLLKHFMLFHGLFDIRDLDRLFAQNGFRIDAVKKRFPEPDNGYWRSFTKYQAELMQRLGIRSVAGLTLLSKAKAAKNIGSLDGFIRHSMLERPASFDIADQLCLEFTEIEQLYRTVLDQKARADHLASVPEEHTRYLASEGTEAASQRLLGAPLKVFGKAIRRRLIDDRLDEIEASQLQLADRKDYCADAVNGSTRAQELLQDQIRDLDGGALGRLEIRHADAAALLAATTDRQRKFSQTCEGVGLAVPQTFDEFQAVKAQASALLAECTAALPAATAKQAAAGAALGEARRDHRACETELSSLRSRQSLIPAYNFDKRLEISRATGISVGLMPYAAELIDIRPDQLRWHLAAERVLRALGLTLLVPQTHIETVKAYINDNDMRGRVVCTPVPAHTDRRVQPGAKDTLLSKITLVQHPMADWLWNKIARSGAAVCVSSLDQLQLHPHAVTVQGTEYHGDRYVKNDDPRTAQRTNWILGSDNKPKIEQLQRHFEVLTAQVEELDDLAEQATTARDDLNRTLTRLEAFGQTPQWSDIDLITAKRDLNQALEQLQQARDGNHQVAAMRHELGRLKMVHRTLEQDLAKASLAQETASTEGNELVDLRQRLDTDLGRSAALDPSDFESLERRFGGVWPGLEQLDATLHRVEKEIAGEQAAARAEQADATRNLEKTFTGYLTRWPEEAAELRADIACAAEFVARYSDIMAKGLPQRQAKFRSRLETDAVERLVLLLQSVDEERRKIKQRITQVNQSLSTTQYNVTDGGTYLQIVFRESLTTDFKQFRQHIHQAFPEGGAVQNDLDRKRQFDALRVIIARMTSPDDRRWKDNVLDVRKAFEFHGEEVNHAGDWVRSWWNTNSNSGGEQEKIVAFCLSAALSYQFSEPGSSYPTFGTVMMDEAFSKSDETFTDQAMSAFTAFGFQLILAAPVRMAPVLEPYLGGLMLVKKREDPHTRHIKSEGFYMPLSELTAEFGGDVSEVD